MSWYRPDFVQITHLPTGLKSRVEICYGSYKGKYRRGWTAAKALAWQILKSKLLFQKTQTHEVVRSYDLIENEKATTEILNGKIPLKQNG